MMAAIIAGIAREGAMNVVGDTRVVRVFVSSPIDVAPERGRAQAVAAKLNREYDGLVAFETVLWEERFYTADKSFQPQIAEAVACDIVVSIFWTRIGTEQPPDFPRCRTAGLTLRARPMSFSPLSKRRRVGACRTSMSS